MGESNFQLRGSSPTATKDRVRLAILRDFSEEGWPSMDLVAEMLAVRLQDEHTNDFDVRLLCPEFRRRASRIPIVGRSRTAWNIDRALNRWRTYPQFLKQQVRNGDVFHVSDHSYAHLVHELPNDRTTVFCHDLDAFRCVLHPDRESRPQWFRRMMQRVLHGMQQAAFVFHSTNAVREQILSAGVVPSERLVHAPYGTSPEFTHEPHEADASNVKCVTGTTDRPYLLHVGSCILRKRIDVLLEVFAAARKPHAELQLVQVGGEWTGDQMRQLSRLGLTSSVIQVRGLDRRQLAALYRRANVVLQTSEAEGFGLPVIEALACGAAVIASDLPVLREVGGEAATYCPVGDVASWTNAVNAAFDSNRSPSMTVRLRQAERYSWSNHTKILAETWRRLI